MLNQFSRLSRHDFVSQNGNALLNRAVIAGMFALADFTPPTQAEDATMKSPFLQSEFGSKMSDRLANKSGGESMCLRAIPLIVRAGTRATSSRPREVWWSLIRLTGRRQATGSSLTM